MSLKYEIVLYKDPYDTDLCYYRHARRHRLIGPADIRGEGTMFWFQYGLSHRMDGPSDVYLNNKYHGYIYGYFIHGTQYSEEDYESEISKH